MALTTPQLLDQPHMEETASKPRLLSPWSSCSLLDTLAKFAAVYVTRGLMEGA